MRISKITHCCNAALGAALIAFGSGCAVKVNYRQGAAGSFDSIVGQPLITSGRAAGAPTPAVSGNPSWQEDEFVDVTQEDSNSSVVTGPSSDPIARPEPPSEPATDETTQVDSGDKTASCIGQIEKESKGALKNSEILIPTPNDAEKLGYSFSIKEIHNYAISNLGRSEESPTQCLMGELNVSDVNQKVFSCNNIAISLLASKVNTAVQVIGGDQRSKFLYDIDVLSSNWIAALNSDSQILILSADENSIQINRVNLGVQASKADEPESISLKDLGIATSGDIHFAILPDQESVKSAIFFSAIVPDEGIRVFRLNDEKGVVTASLLKEFLIQSDSEFSKNFRIQPFLAQGSYVGLLYELLAGTGDPQSSGITEKILTLFGKVFHELTSNQFLNKKSSEESATVVEASSEVTGSEDLSSENLGSDELGIFVPGNGFTRFPTSQESIEKSAEKVKWTAPIEDAFYSRLLSCIGNQKDSFCYARLSNGKYALGDQIDRKTEKDSEFWKDSAVTLNSSCGEEFFYTGSTQPKIPGALADLRTYSVIPGGNMDADESSIRSVHVLPMAKVAGLPTEDSSDKGDSADQDAPIDSGGSTSDDNSGSGSGTDSGSSTGPGGSSGSESSSGSDSSSGSGGSSGSEGTTTTPSSGPTIISSPVINPLAAPTGDLISTALYPYCANSFNCRISGAELSEDGKYALFAGYYPLSPMPIPYSSAENAYNQVYRKSLTSINESTNDYILVSSNVAGQPANGNGCLDSYNGWGILDIDPTGRYVVFACRSTNLVPGVTEKTLQIYAKDLNENKITLVSVSDTGIVGRPFEYVNPVNQWGAGVYAPLVKLVVDDGKMFVTFRAASDTLLPNQNFPLLETTGSGFRKALSLQTLNIYRKSIDFSSQAPNSAQISHGALVRVTADQTGKPMSEAPSGRAFLSKDGKTAAIGQETSYKFWFSDSVKKYGSNAINYSPLIAPSVAPVLDTQTGYIKTLPEGFESEGEVKVLSHLDLSDNRFKFSGPGTPSSTEPIRPTSISIQGMSSDAKKFLFSIHDYYAYQTGYAFTRALGQIFLKTYSNATDFTMQTITKDSEGRNLCENALYPTAIMSADAKSFVVTCNELPVGSDYVSAQKVLYIHLNDQNVATAYRIDPTPVVCPSGGNAGSIAGSITPIALTGDGSKLLVRSYDCSARSWYDGGRSVILNMPAVD